MPIQGYHLDLSTGACGAVLRSWFSLARNVDLKGLRRGESAEEERKKTDNPREGWEDGTPPPHRDFKEGTVW